MKRPRTTDVSELRVVRTASGPGKRAETMPAAEIAPSIWARAATAPFSHPTAPTKHMPKVT